ncbi:hypothetical protein ABW20_dc0106885 [Dactylellina cionopaga]|nr:hypothetical protein ABW20_dc0106885 [Dactylellina cionopaga]
MAWSSRRIYLSVPILLLLFLPWMFAYSPPLVMVNGSYFTIFETDTSVEAMKVGTAKMLRQQPSTVSISTPDTKFKCPCNLDNVTLEAKPKEKTGDPFSGNSALLFAYAQTLAGIMAPGIELGSAKKAIYLVPPFYQGIVIEEPDPDDLMNYQLWQYADGMPSTNSPVWDHDGDSYFDFYNEYAERCMIL